MKYVLLDVPCVTTGNLWKIVICYLRGSVLKLDVEKYLCRTV